MISIKNYMELAVKSEVGQQKSAGEKNRSGCWCDLCAADISSLSLTSLPPRYCMERSYGLMADRILPGTVRNAVKKSMTKIFLRPKHRLGHIDYYPHRIRIINFALEEGNALVRSVMAGNSSPCLCFQCSADTLAFALNRFPPLYGVECDGSTNFPQDQREFFRHDLCLVLQQAANVVSQHPHH